ncbi:MAG: DNA replication and repair protein RecF [Candidatus Mycalebacterium zealandia]|nr:MAG: DNA replication and repair protein RecF [Candidatus Mycalebacterium zealandia]
MIFPVSQFTIPVLIVKSLSLRDIRCYASETLSFHPRFNLVYGENGQGKTNLLEAVYMLCRFKPLRGVSSSEIVRFGGRSSALLKGVIEKDSPALVTDVSVSFSDKGGKKVEVNGKRPANLAKKALDFEVVHFTPSEVELAKGSPSLRRRYFDSIICGLVPSHFQDILDFQRVLRQRNSFLASGRATSSGIALWDGQMAEIGARIVEKRLRLVKRINREIDTLYRGIGGADMGAKAQYETSFEISGGKRGELSNSIKKALENGFSRDTKARHTSTGPHRDRISLQIGGKDCALFASQGEARSVVLALKMAEIRLYQEIKKENPIFLLDDISSELDGKRRKFLFDMLLDYPGQVFVTSTSASDILYRGKHKKFRIQAGKVAE